MGWEKLSNTVIYDDESDCQRGYEEQCEYDYEINNDQQDEFELHEYVNPDLFTD